MTENFVKRKYVHGLQFAPFSCEWTIVRVGSCGLHVVHGAFETGFKATDYWNLCGILKAMH